MDVSLLKLQHLVLGLKMLKFYFRQLCIFLRCFTGVMMGSSGLSASAKKAILASAKSKAHKVFKWELSCCRKNL